MEINEFQVPVEDRGVFVKFMAYLARADNKVSIEEKQAIDDIIFAWQLDEQTIEEIYSILQHGIILSELSSSFKNKKSAYLLIQELITLGHLDGKYGDEERKAVNKISTLLKITPKRIKELEDWVAEGMAWRKKGIRLITPEGE